MSTKSKKKPQTGVRYSDAEKQKIVDFVSDYNSSKGRGGQSAASNKFKVSPLTIATWIKNSGKKVVGKAAKVVAKKAVKPAKAVKAAKVAKSAGASKMGVRYAPEQKQEVVKFVQDYNAANGRGGQSNAATKFNLSVLTVSAWLKAAGVKGSKIAKVSKKAAKGSVVKASKSSAASIGLAAKVASLVSISEQVNKAEMELEKLYTKHDAIMASIKNWI